jgi:CRISPR-associated protein Csm1
MNEKALLDASCRVALAALLHDLGKFAERAGLELEGDVLEANLHQYARPQQAGGRQWYSHRHAAYTAIAIDLLERRFPRLKGQDVVPFAAWDSPEVDDSLINAAARHHRPETFLQWIVATADRIASGFERETFDSYNDAPEETSTRRNHITARQLTLFEQIRMGTEEAGLQTLHWRYPLKPLSPASLFPVEVDRYESDDKEAAMDEYRRLWDGFAKALGDVPSSHQARLDLWLDHFDTLLSTYTHAIPAATAFKVKPEVSLYDHSKAVAALAVALWRYHQERADEPETIVHALRERADWGEPKLLLIQGDLFGIQEFIFATGGETQRWAAKLLRGRSFYVGLLTECAALRILDALSLPPTSQIINAAGKFLIVAPNTDGAREAMERLRKELDAWFLQHSHGQWGLGLAWLEAASDDFLRSKGEGHGGGSRFAGLMQRLFAQLELAKAQRFALCADPAPGPLFEGFLDAFGNGLGACQIDGRSPAVHSVEDAGHVLRVSALAKDQIDLGNWLTRFERLLISREGVGDHTLSVDLFGYRVSFTEDEGQSGRFGPEVTKGNLLRAWDFSLPHPDPERPLWTGYARRHINAYIARFHGDEASNPWDAEKYSRCEPDEAFQPRPREPKTLNHLACEDTRPDEAGRWVGVRALMTLKGDVDNLGLIFQRGLAQPTFAKMAALSRQLNAFFAVYLPWLCQTEFGSVYTVFAGGDDFFLIGPWHSQITLAGRLRQEFSRYVANNPGIHFSAGLSMTKPGLPIRHLAELGEQALEAAKAKRAEKDCVTCFGETVAWPTFEALAHARAELERLAGQLKLSTGYVYGLLDLVHKAERVGQRPENAIWHSHFAYRTRRLIERDRRLSQAEQRRLQQELASVIAQNGIEQFGGAYRIALFAHLYQVRD